MDAKSGREIDVAALAEEIERRIEALLRANTPSVRAVRREFSRRIAGADSREVIELALRLQQRPGVHRFVGDELIVSHKRALSALTKRDLERLGRGMDSWDKVDCFATYLSGPAWREGQISDATVHGWARSRDRWWRRAALVSTVALKVKARGGTGDAERTLAVCRLLVRDRDDMVVKAMSWALRALSRHDSPAVRRFLDDHEGEVAARVLREVRHKLQAGLKSPRRRAD